MEEKVRREKQLETKPPIKSKVLLKLVVFNACRASNRLDKNKLQQKEITKGETKGGAESRVGRGGGEVPATEEWYPVYVSSRKERTASKRGSWLSKKNKGGSALTQNRGGKGEEG